jgi:hypothetical protein
MPDINTIIAWLAIAQVRAILIGLVIAWAGTQFFKSAPWLAAKPDRARRWWIRAGAFALGFLPTFLLWPSTRLEAAVYASAVGLAAPFVYAIGARVLYHFFPWLEPKMSSAPLFPEPRA